LHVLVSKDFEVTGTEQGGPPAGAAPPAGNATQSLPHGLRTRLRVTYGADRFLFAPVL
jgi:hypothetical protein